MNIRDALRTMVEEGMASPINGKPMSPNAVTPTQVDGHALSKRSNGEYPNQDEIVAKSRDLIAMTIMKMVAREPKDTMAFKLGLVDAHGIKLREPKTPEEDEAYNSIERLAFILRSLLGPKARTLRVYAPKGGMAPEEITPNFLVLGKGMDRGSVLKFLERLEGKNSSTGKSLGGAEQK